jgi:hypothetical protein
VDDAPQVTMVVESDSPGTLIERRANAVEGWQTTLGIPVYTSTEQWEPACAAPCRVMVNPNAAFRVNGRGIATSRDFVLPPDDGKGEVRLDVRTRSAFWHGVGQTMTVVGAVLVVIGGISTLYAPSITSTEEEKTLRSFGVSFLAGGGLMLGIGIPLWITQRSWVRGPDGSAL